MYVESRKNLIYNEYFEELTNVLKDSEELLAYTQYEWYFFVLFLKPLLQDFKRIRCCRLQEIFLSCRASLGSLHEERLPHLFQLFIHYPPEEIPPPPSLGTHADERQTDRQGSHEKVPHSYTEIRRRQDRISPWCMGPAQGPTASGRKGRPRSVSTLHCIS